jgi:hypothetical protein
VAASGTEDATPVALLPFYSDTFTHINSVLSKYKTRTVIFSPRKVANFLWPVNDNLALKTLFAQPPSVCWALYIEDSG